MATMINREQGHTHTKVINYIYADDDGIPETNISIHHYLQTCKPQQGIVI